MGQQMITQEWEWGLKCKTTEPDGDSERRALGRVRCSLRESSESGDTACRDCLGAGMEKAPVCRAGTAEVVIVQSFPTPLQSASALGSRSITRGSATCMAQSALGLSAEATNREDGS